MDAGRFGNRLRELREAAGLSQAELASRAKVSQGGLAHWEQGIRKPPGFLIVLRICEVLGVDCTAFQQPPAGATEEPPPPKRPRGRPKKPKE